MDSVRDLWSTVRGGTYYTRRGPIWWAGFPFDAYPRACSIQVSEEAPFAQINTAQIVFEVAASLRPETVETLGIDDGLLDEFKDDAAWVAIEWSKKLNSLGDSLLIHADLNRARVVEFYDADLRVQGISFFVRVSV